MPNEFKSVLLIIGVILLLLGLVGQIKAKIIEVGTKNKIVRIVSSLIGVAFILISLGIIRLPHIIGQNNGSSTENREPGLYLKSPGKKRDRLSADKLIIERKREYDNRIYNDRPLSIIEIQKDLEDKNLCLVKDVNVKTPLTWVHEIGICK